jgi:diaminopimelate decarboxylase
MTVTADEADRWTATDAVDQTPYLVIDVATAAAQYRRIAQAFAGAHEHYAVKAHPEAP